MLSKNNSLSTIHEDRPRERLYNLGAEALSTTELIAILLGSGVKGKSVLHLSQEILSHFGSLENLIDASVDELQQIKGVGFAKALQLKAALHLGLRAQKMQKKPKYPIKQPLHAYQLIKDGLENQKKENFAVIMQDVKGNAINQEIIAVGTLSQVLVHPREVFHRAIRHRAASIIVAHNHPSGDPEPSDPDIQLTKKLVQAGSVLGIPLKDHIIIGHGRFVSLKDRGYI
ncbi:MAG: DNA repair protein RadC [Parachlamydiales bacterium]|nr:DNA repair protein RadC [Parachlamydiales bacterium]